MALFHFVEICAVAFDHEYQAIHVIEIIENDAKLLLALEFLDSRDAFYVEAVGGVHRQESVGRHVGDHLCKGRIVVVRLALEAHDALDDVCLAQVGGVFGPLP